MNSSTKTLVKIATIAGIYTALTVFFAPISFMAVQFRVAEALAVLPLLMPSAIVGLTIGCFLSNLIASTIPLDIVLGTAATLVAAIATRYSRKIYFGVIPPIVINALVVPLMFLSVPEITQVYWVNVLMIGAGQAGAVLALGIPLYFGVKKIKPLYS